MTIALQLPLVVALPDPLRGIELWMCDLDCDDITEESLAQSLSPEERARAARFGTDALRRRWIAGRACLRFVLARKLGVDPAAVQLRRGRRGRPELAHASAVDFNVTHTQGTALIGISDAFAAGVRIGVDLERADRVINADGLSRKFLTARERAALQPMTADERRQTFLRLWTCKEAMSKATGDALSAPFREIDVALSDGLRLLAGRRPYLPEHWQLIAVDVPDDFIASLAVWRAS